MFSRNRVNGSEKIQVWAHCLSLSCVVGLCSASRRNGTGVLWVLTGTTFVMTHPGRVVSHQSASSCSALLLGFVLCGCRVRVLKWAIFDHTPSPEHTCRGFRRLEHHLFVETLLLDLCSCTPRVHLLRVAMTSTRFHIHVNSIELCSRRHFTILGHAH